MTDLVYLCTKGWVFIRVQFHFCFRLHRPKSSVLQNVLGKFHEKRKAETLELVRMLVEAGASLGENDDTEEQEVVTAAVKSKDEDVMDVVLEGFLDGRSQREVRG